MVFQVIKVLKVYMENLANEEKLVHVVFKALKGNREVDQRYFNADIWQVVGVCELSCHVKLEIFAVRNGFATQLYLFDSA